MKKLILFSCLLLVIFSCKNKNGAVPINFHEITAKQSVNTSEYTYVLVSESGKEQWLAIPRTEIEVGATYYYQGGMNMENFQSKELGKTFESVVFLEGLSKDKDNLATQPPAPMMGPKSDEKHKNINSVVQKSDVKVEKAQGGISIAELFAQKDQYNGKVVKISGQVTKFSPDIMKKNWIHIQDGTDSNGKFDLTVTTSSTATVGDKITFEGKIAIDKDFGYGYFYDVLMEDALKVK